MLRKKLIVVFLAEMSGTNTGSCSVKMFDIQCIFAVTSNYASDKKKNS